MAPNAPDKFENVTAVCKANVYFDGKVVSHTILFKDGTKKTLGLIYPGTYKFDTAGPEKMEIIAGACQVRQAGQAEWTTYAASSFFHVAGNSSFEISVDQAQAEYICSYE